MSLVLEGPDGAGKTTLARTLQKMDPRLEYYHSGGAPHNVEEENQFLREQQYKAHNPITIIDRLTSISQQVYRDGRMFEPKLWQALDGVLAAGAVIIYCRPSTDHLMSPEKLNWRDVETEEYKQEVIRKQHTFIARYDQLMQHVPHLHFSFEEQNVEELISLIVAAPFSNDAMATILKQIMLGRFRGYGRD